MSDMRRMMMMFTRPVDSGGSTVPVPTISPSAGAILPTQTISISISGIATSAEYSFNNQTWLTYSSPFTLPSATTVYARAADGSGNYSEVVSNAYTILPYDAQVEYLQSSGTQWIDTGYKINNVDSFEIIIVTNGTTKYMGSNGNLQVDLSVSKNLGKRTIKVTHSANDGPKTYVNDSLVKSQSYHTYNGYIIALFAMGTSSSAVGYHSSAAVYSSQLIINNTLVRDFIPVRKDGVGYMYDKVSGELFGNNGSGSFTYGNDVTI